jgi:hypothetical protein
MNRTRLAIAAALLMTNGTAVAQSATDVGCLILSNGFAHNSKDANAQKAAEAASFFYLGRVSNQGTAAQLKALLEKEMKTITQANAGPMMNACMKELEAKSQLVQSLSPRPKPPAAQPVKKP